MESSFQPQDYADASVTVFLTFRRDPLGIGDRLRAVATPEYVTPKDSQMDASIPHCTYPPYRANWLLIPAPNFEYFNTLPAEKTVFVHSTPGSGDAGHRRASYVGN